MSYPIIKNLENIVINEMKKFIGFNEEEMFIYGFDCDIVDHEIQATFNNLENKWFIFWHDYENNIGFLKQLISKNEDENIIIKKWGNWEKEDISQIQEELEVIE